MTIDDVLDACARLAGEIPFVVLERTGKIRHASDGARDALDHAVLVFGDGVRIRIEPGQLLDSLPTTLWESGVSGSPVHLIRNDNSLATYALQALPILGAPPEMMFLRFDPISFGVISEEGIPVISPAELPGASMFFEMWTRSKEMTGLFQSIERISASDVTVLIRGESGTGKEHVANAIHALSSRKNGPFVAINCATISQTLIESELFGHEKGAFTGAVRAHKGLFEQADGGTILLDEVAELPLEMQSKLLRVLQERTILPVGGTKPRSVDVRVISATHRSLRDEVEAGRFRDDLMYRLRVVPLYLPPLRERRTDIELLVMHFLKQNQEKANRHSFDYVDPVAMRVLIEHTWPGNIRELRNVVKYAGVVGTGNTLTTHDLTPELKDSLADRARRRGNRASSGRNPHIAHLDRASHREEIGGDGRRAGRSDSSSQYSPNQSTPNVSDSTDEITRIRQALDAAGGNRGLAAERLGMHRTTLWRKLRTLGIDS